MSKEFLIAIVAGNGAGFYKVMELLIAGVLGEPTLPYGNLSWAGVGFLFGMVGSGFALSMPKSLQSSLFFSVSAGLGAALFLATCLLSLSALSWASV